MNFLKKDWKTIRLLMYVFGLFKNNWTISVYPFSTAWCKEVKLTFSENFILIFGV